MAARSVWIACWEQIEAFSRDAAKWYDTCGDSCSLTTLTEWRGRVLVQLRQALSEEQAAFDRLRGTEAVLAQEAVAVKGGPVQ